MKKRVFRLCDCRTAFYLSLRGFRPFSAACRFMTGVAYLFALQMQTGRRCGLVGPLYSACRRVRPYALRVAALLQTVFHSDRAVTPSQISSALYYQSTCRFRLIRQRRHPFTDYRRSLFLYRFRFLQPQAHFYSLRKQDFSACLTSSAPRSGSK